MTEIISILGKKAYLAIDELHFGMKIFLITKIKSLKFQINPSWQNLKNKTFFFWKDRPIFWSFL